MWFCKENHWFISHTASFINILLFSGVVIIHTVIFNSDMVKYIPKQTLTTNNIKNYFLYSDRFLRPVSQKDVMTSVVS